MTEKRPSTPGFKAMALMFRFGAKRYIISPKYDHES